MKAAIYARVSTTDQTCENQLRELRAYCKARGLTATEFVDAGVSGAKESRPALEAMLREARRRKFEPANSMEAGSARSQPAPSDSDAR
jgi:DNA invertase Pin-like site-specific DNA recombinase